MLGPGGGREPRTRGGRFRETMTPGTQDPSEPSDASPPGAAPQGRAVYGAPRQRMTRRRFLVQGAALVGTGVVLGAGAVIAVTEQGRHAGPSETPAPEPTAGPTGTPASGGPSAAPSAPVGSIPEGILPTPPGASLEPIQSAPPRGPGRSARENLRRGTKAWELPVHGKGNAEAYASDVSVADGDRLELHVSSTQPRATITLYRLGWYGGAGARVVERWRDVPISSQPAPTTDPVSGLIRAPWSAAVTANVPEGWVSGLYLAVVAPVGGAPQYCTFVVRERQPAAPILFVSATTTHQAYNGWGGKSLYPDESSGAPTVSGGANAVTVSWDRPYAVYRGGGLVLRWEYPFVRWMESRGYGVEYAADLDLDRHHEVLTGRRLIVFAGHPEYWSVPMRTALEGAIAAGTNVAFFSANEIYWRVRYEPENGPYRTVTCYRKKDLDPLAASDPVHATTRWRDSPTPLPESHVVGQMYGHMVLTPTDFVCSAPGHWLYEGTGMRSGDAIANLIGQEYDRFWSEPGFAPAGTEILATSPTKPNLGHAVDIYGPPPPNEPWPPVHNATIYIAPSGATVFSAGTMQWSWALDDWGAPDWEGIRTPVDPRVARMTANVLDRLGGSGRS